MDADNTITTAEQLPEVQQPEPKPANSWVCPTCGATFHTLFNPSSAGDKCDKCGAELTIRKDDKPEVVRDRLKVYHTETEPLERYYADKGILKTVAGQEKLEDTTALTFKAIGE